MIQPSKESVELVAEDYVYSIKRILDPKIMPSFSFIDNKLVGANALVECQ